MSRLWVYLSALLMAGCSSLLISTDYDEQADFAAIKTYAWLAAPKIESGDPQIQYNSLLGRRVRSAVETQLARKGLVRQAADADVLVTYHVVVDRKISVTYLNELFGYGPGWGPAYRRRLLHYGYPRGDALVNEYTQGTLIVDIVRAADKQLIWRGTASDEVYPDSSMEAREQRVSEAVAKMFSHYPPSAR